MAKDVRRRTVLKVITLGAFGLGSVWPSEPAGNPHLPDGQKVALAKGVILADKSLCSGCRVCEIVCANFNSGGRNSLPFRGSSWKRKSWRRLPAKVCTSAPTRPVSKPAGHGPAGGEARGTYARIIDERRASAARNAWRPVAALSARRRV